jgi:hypothetical protein
MPLKSFNPSIPQTIFKERMLLAFLSLFVILLQTYCWSWQTSGVVWMTQEWASMPWGYRWIIRDPVLGEWSINKELLYYIHHFLSFIGTPDIFIDRGSGFELHRTLYALLIRPFWFLGPILAGLLVNVIAWWGAAMTAAYLAYQLIGKRFVVWAAVVFVVFGQGFLQSVGEISPHVLGYALGYYIFAFAVYKKLWSPQTTFVDHLMVYGFVGIMKLAYESAWLTLPPLTLVSLYAFYQSLEKERFWRRYRLLTVNLSLCISFALLPGIIFIIVTSLLLKANGSLQYGCLTQTPLNFLRIYGHSLMEGFLSYGPILVPLFIASGLMAFLKRERIWIIIWVFAILQFICTTPFLMKATGRGYITFSLSPLVMLSILYVVQHVWTLRRSQIFARFSVIVVTLLGAVYVNLPLTGYMLPLNGFSLGYLATWKKERVAYDIIEF